ncbi:hypothetical protein [Paenisporosarcina sp. TG20]|uniref:hypothetical protein n=1 Tax=Paenisporosarcina sp. TG20 TaxID=1211706 RepID=UPI00030D7F0A|nr:hypothetical protein [Paenisporosarcina sp. TG20]
MIFIPWNKDDYPDSFNILNSQVRGKAIEIAIALLRDGMAGGRAIAIATEKAREYVGGNKYQDEFHVVSHSDGWQLMKESSNSAIFVEETKISLLDEIKALRE